MAELAIERKRIWMTEKPTEWACFSLNSLSFLRQLFHCMLQMLDAIPHNIGESHQIGNRACQCTAQTFLRQSETICFPTACNLSSSSKVVRACGELFVFSMFFFMCMPCRQASRSQWAWRTPRDMCWMAEHITEFQTITRFQTETQWDQKNRKPVDSLLQWRASIKIDHTALGF